MSGTVTRIREGLQAWHNWIHRRNPAYLASACLMAIGARLLLVSEKHDAGLLSVIFLTLIVIQLYVWSVGAVIMSLHAFGRGGTDRSHLLLLFAAFWTGPMTATIELSLSHPLLGLIVGLAAAVIAMIEYRLILGFTGLRVSHFTTAAAFLLLITIAAVPPTARAIQSHSSALQLLLHVAWCVPACMCLLTLSALRRHSPAPVEGSARVWIGRRFRPGGLPGLRELIFQGLLVSACVAHLAGIQHAFLADWSWINLCPLLTGLSLYGMALSEVFGRKHGKNACMCVPLAILGVGWMSPDAPVPLGAGALHAGLVGAMLCATITWSYAAIRFGSRIALHAAGAAAAMLLLGVIDVGARTEHLARVGGESSSFVSGSAALAGVVSLYLATYAMLTRRRYEGVAAAGLLFLSGILWLSDRTDSLVLQTVLMTPWLVIAMYGLSVRNCRTDVMAGLLLVIMLLAAATWIDEDMRLLAQVYGAAAFATCLTGGIWFQARSMLVTSLATAGALLLGQLWRMASIREQTTPLMLIFASFTLLAFGAMISWRKDRRSNGTNAPM